MAVGRIIATLMAAALISSCATGVYRPESIDSVAFRDRAETQVEGNIRVTVAIPDVEEARAIFGFPIYDKDIQPIWLEIENSGVSWVRFAPHGTDPDYYPPLEVAWGFRGGFAKAAESEMAHYLHENSMPRRIPAGEARSGFIFTRANPGTKDFNVDVFGTEEDHSFAFYVDVPGFVADHAGVDFEALYRPDEIEDYTSLDFLDELTGLPCCAQDESGERKGAPVNVVLVAKGKGVLHALLRAGWKQTPQASDEDELEQQKRGQFLFGRPADALFRKKRDTSGRRATAGERNELRLWLAPVTVEGEEVWAGQASHFIARALGDARLDPDIDDARMYMAQIMWYGQTLRKMGWSKGEGAVPIDMQKTDVNGAPFFTDGYRAVMWLSGDPVSMLESRRIGRGKVPTR
jgi:hypothetical protein